jgi:hypothetical protein
MWARGRRCPDGGRHAPEPPPGDRPPPSTDTRLSSATCRSRSPTRSRSRSARASSRVRSALVTRLALPAGLHGSSSTGSEQRARNVAAAARLRASRSASSAGAGVVIGCSFLVPPVTLPVQVRAATCSGCGSALLEHRRSQSGSSTSPVERGCKTQASHGMPVSRCTMREMVERVVQRDCDIRYARAPSHGPRLTKAASMSARSSRVRGRPSLIGPARIARRPQRSEAAPP